MHGGGSVALVFEADVSIAGFRLIQLDQFLSERGDIDVFGGHVAAAAVGLGDLKQGAQRSLHAIQARRALRPSSRERCRRGPLMLERLFDTHARAIQRCAQIVGGAIESRAKGFGLLLDGFEHAIHGDCERIEFVVRLLDGQAL